MATWVSATSTSSGGNITMYVAGGYGSVSRSGNTVSFSWGVRFQNNGSWTYNSVAAFPGGTRYWAFNSNSGSNHTANSTWYYAASSTKGTYTSESTPNSYSGTVSGTSSGNVSVSVGVGWNAWTPSSTWTYSFSVPYSAVPSQPTYTVSVSPSRTSATMTMKITANPSNFWRIHWYNTGGSWQGCSPFSTGTWTYTQDSLTPNTSYNFYTQIGAANDTNLQGTVARSFTTTGNAPTISSVSASPSRTTATISHSTSYDTNASYKSISIKYGTSTSYGSTSSSTSLSGLSPNTTYYYSVTVTDNWNRTSGAKTGSFKTTCNKPSSLSISRSSSTTTGITVAVSATGDTNAPITDYTLYYKLSSASSYSSTSLGTSTSKALTGLNTDADYNMYFTATNAGGTTTSSTVTYSTLLTNPTIGAPTASGLTPFAVTIKATGSITPSRTLQYRFSKDNGSTWTAYQSSNTYNWTGLTEETTYQMKVQVKATHTGTNASDTTATSSTLSVTTLADQAKIRIKKQLPSGYTQLTYVDSSGTQYVDTGLLTESGYTFEYKLQWRALSSSQTSWLLGSNNGFRLYVPYVNTNGTWGDGYAGTTYSSGPNPTINTDYTILDINEVGKQKTIINGTTIFDKTDATDGSNNYHLLLFGQTYGGATVASNLSSVRLYYLNIYNKGIMVRAFVPCKRNSDNKIGLYDLVEDKFYQSATSTALLAGSTTTNTGNWVKGKTYFKKNGQWVKAKKVYRKVNGVWKIGIND